MKKLALVLAVALLAVPAFAATVTVVPTGPGTADINYDNNGEDVAAYAIDIMLSAGDINEVTNFHVGVSTAADPGYGIFPANFDRFITVNGAGDVDNWGVAGYTPAADVNDKGAVTMNGVTIELGALYKGDANKPAGTGTLCSISVTEGCDVTLAQNTIRGGIVLANAGAPASVTLNGATIAPIGPGECFPSTDPAYSDWVAFGKPECWCLTTQCHGDADGLKEGSAKGGYKRVFLGDLDILIAGWNIIEPPHASSTGSIMDVPNGICADFDHLQEGSTKGGFKRVFIGDLNILIANWNIIEPPHASSTGSVATDCPGDIDPQP